MTKTEKLEVLYSQRCPRKYINCSFDNFQGDITGFKNWLNNNLNSFYEYSSDNKTVLFTGAVGTGKTHLLFASFRLSYVEKGIFAYYTTLSDFLREYNEKQFKDHSHEQLLRDVKKVPVLLIDEITRLKSTETELDIIFRLIDYRTSNNMLTLLACNILGDVYSELSKFLGQAVTDRILDRQQVKLIPLGSKSHRTGV